MGLLIPHHRLRRTGARITIHAHVFVKTCKKRVTFWKSEMLNDWKIGIRLRGPMQTLQERLNEYFWASIETRGTKKLEALSITKQIIKWACSLNSLNRKTQDLAKQAVERMVCETAVRPFVQSWYPCYLCLSPLFCVLCSVSSVLCFLCFVFSVSLLRTQTVPAYRNLFTCPLIIGSIFLFYTRIPVVGLRFFVLAHGISLWGSDVVF